MDVYGSLEPLADEKAGIARAEGAYEERPVAVYVSRRPVDRAARLGITPRSKDWKKIPRADPKGTEGNIELSKIQFANGTPRTKWP